MGEINKRKLTNTVFVTEKNKNEYKLPGGGMEENETKEFFKVPWHPYYKMCTEETLSIAILS